MKRVFLFASIIFLGLIVQAQTLEGYITDTKGNAIPGVNIVVQGTNDGAVSNSDGFYTIKLDLKTYILKISMIAYKTVQSTVSIKKGENKLNFTLEQELYFSEEVIVSATRAGDKTPTAYTNISKDELNKRNSGQDIPFMLELTPSAVATSEAGTGIGYTNFRIRGSDPTRINVTINGIPINDAESHSVFWVNLPDFTSSVQSVQIQRGVGTSTNGAAAFGATMNFQTIGSSKKPYAQIQTTVGSFNTFKENVSIGTGIMDNGLSFDIRLSKLNSDGYIDYSGSNHHSMYISGAWRDENNLIRANIIYGNERTGISWWGTPKDSLETNRTFNPAGEYLDANGNRQYYKGQIDNYQQTHYQLIYSRKLGNYMHFNTALHYTKGGGYYEQYKDVDYENTFGWGDITEMSLAYYNLPNIVLSDDTITHSDLIRRKMMENDFFGGTMSLKYKKGRLNTSIGGGWNRYLGDHFGQLIWMRNAAISEVNHEYYRNTGDKIDMNVFLKVNYTIATNLYAYGDLQYRYIDYKIAGLDDDRLPNGNQKVLDQNHTFNFFNPKAGLLYQITNSANTYFSVAVGNREPTRANFADATGDANNIPKSEQLIDYELGYQYSSNKFSAMINMYFMNYKNQLVPTGEKNSVGYDIMTNVAESYRTGIELSAGVQAFDCLYFNANLSLSQNKIMNFNEWATHYAEDWSSDYIATNLGTTDIAYSPSIVSSAVLRWNTFKGFNISWIAKYVGKQYFDNTMSQQRMLDPYFANNIQLDYNIPVKKLEKIALRFNIQNVFNVKYSSNAYGGAWYEQGVEKTWSYYYPQAGRYFMGGITIRI